MDPFSRPVKGLLLISCMQLSRVLPPRARAETLWLISMLKSYDHVESGACLDLPVLPCLAPMRFFILFVVSSDVPQSNQSWVRFAIICEVIPVTDQRCRRKPKHDWETSMGHFDRQCMVVKPGLDINGRLSCCHVGRS